MECSTRSVTTWVPGVVSATFKKTSLTVDDILALMKECGLRTVEWSENVHVFPSDLTGAELLGRKTRDAGFSVAAYGSYYRIAGREHVDADFAESLAAANALGAPVIRIWAGEKPSAEVSEEEVYRMAREADEAADMAAAQNIKVAFEWHKNTLTDTNESAAKLMSFANNDNLYCLWQPTVALSPRERVEGIQMLQKRLLNFHVYSWPDGKRGPLNEAEWYLYFSAAEQMGGTHAAMLEFVKDDAVEQFRQDAGRLLHVLESGEWNG